MSAQNFIILLHRFDPEGSSLGNYYSSTWRHTLQASHPEHNHQPDQASSKAGKLVTPGVLQYGLLTSIWTINFNMDY